MVHRADSLAKRFATAAVCVVLGGWATAASGQDCAAAGRELRATTVRLHVEATVLATGAIRESFGTGVIVSVRGHVLTNNHVVSPGPDTGQLKIRGSIGSKSASAAPLQVLAQNEHQDLALLQFENSGIDYNAAPIGDPWAVQDGHRLCSGGYPLQVDYVVTDGVLSSKSGPKGWWLSNIATNPGESGAPIIDLAGRIIGLKVGAFEDARSINLLIPINMAAPILMMVPDGAALSERLSRPPSIPDRQVVQCDVDQGRESAGGLVPSSGEYSAHCVARPGYRIIKADLIRLSDNNLSDVRLTTTPDGAQVVLSFRLTSGPIYDRWRGWLSGKIVTQQERVK
jgi:S1-C subfamily serine protease